LSLAPREGLTKVHWPDASRFFFRPSTVGRTPTHSRAQSVGSLTHFFFIELGLELKRRTASACGNCLPIVAAHANRSKTILPFHHHPTSAQKRVLKIVSDLQAPFRDAPLLHRGNVVSGRRLSRSRRYIAIEMDIIFSMAPTQIRRNSITSRRGDPWKKAATASCCSGSIQQDRNRRSGSQDRRRATAQTVSGLMPAPEGVDLKTGPCLSGRTASLAS